MNSLFSLTVVFQCKHTFKSSFVFFFSNLPKENKRVVTILKGQMRATPSYFFKDYTSWPRYLGAHFATF
jgi:hypothetical protein